MVFRESRVVAIPIPRQGIERANTERTYSNEKSRGLSILCSALRARKHKRFFLALQLL